MIQGLKDSGRSQIDISFPEIEKFDRLPQARSTGATAFVSIMEGCSKYCTFCVVPYTRGEEISRPFEQVLAEVGQLAQQGVREITLLGQNVNAYAGPMRGRHARRSLHADSFRRGHRRYRAHPLYDLTPARIQ